MKSRFSLALALTAAVSVPSGADGVGQLLVPVSEPRISIGALRVMLAERRVVVIDVRPASSFRDGHIPGALHIPLDQIERRAGDIKSRTRDQPVVTYCSCPTDHASLEAARRLRALGCRDVSALAGGFPAWVAAGGRIETA